MLKVEKQWEKATMRVKEKLNILKIANCGLSIAD
jgi:hypothetical protein